jgi:hypothetical protein
MKIVIALLFLNLFFALKAQDSFEFLNPMPPNAEKVEAVNPSFYGKYENSETGTEFIINSEGITMVSIIHSFITQEQVRESSKYSFRNGYLFGVVENDSVLYIQEGEKYYFGIKNKMRLNDYKNGAVFKKINENSYVINFKENSSFTPSLLSFSKGKLSLKHFDYPSDGSTFNHVENKTQLQEKSINRIILDPNQKEWDKIDKNVIFGKENLFIKQ